MKAPIIKVRDVWFSYHKHPVLRDVNLSIYSGDFLAVIGPNGGGKTTLLKLMLGLLKPDRGSIRVLGLSPKEAAPRIGYVPQDIGINNSVPVTVHQVTLMGRMKGGGSWRRFTDQDKAEARRALERMEMWDLRRRKMSELSGGQRQRVLVARAMASKPELLVLDEPMANVDTQGQSDFYAFLKELNQTVTIIVVSHDFMVLSSYVQSVACVSRQVFYHDKPEITDDMLRMAYHCPVELIAHGLPHRVLPEHKDE